MRLAKIKNKYMYHGDNPNGYHTYAVYFDKDSKRYRAVQLTHLYIKDEKRFKQVNRGNILVEKFPEFDVPSGVRNQYYDSNVKGGKINLNDPDVISISKRYLNSTQSNRIIKFANKNKKNP